MVLLFLSGYGDGKTDDVFEVII